MGGAMAVLRAPEGSAASIYRTGGDRDMRAMMQFVVLSLVILPCCRTEGFGPYEVWNPFDDLASWLCSLSASASAGMWLTSSSGRRRVHARRYHRRG